MTDKSITNAIRALACDTVQRANSGHPGAPVGMAPITKVLFSEVLKFDPKDPAWIDRDRFVLSNGHASALIYTMLHLTGYKVSMEDMKNFRRIHSITPGHPERGVTEGVEVTTGPLGQGVSNAVGLAIAEAQLAATFNKPDAKLIDHYTYAFAGDGCLMEGVAQEALSLAGHLQLNKLIVIYDDNHITIDGNTKVTFTEDTGARYRALGFHIIYVNDGNTDYKSIRGALAEAKKQTEKPTMIVLKTTIGFESSVADSAKAHGSPFGAGEVKRLKGVWGRDPEKTFFVEDEVYEFFKKSTKSGAAANVAWKKAAESYASKYPAEYAIFEKRVNNVLPAEFKDKLPRNTKKAVATRASSEAALGVLLNELPQLAGGSADLTGSNLTNPKVAKLKEFQKSSQAGRYFYFGVREHGMSAVLNGMHAHGGFIPYGATFLNFIGYALGAVRLSALSHHQVIFVATHDSIGQGQDGPTHQTTDLPATLRAIPNLHFIRPADQTETSAAWALAIESKKTPSILSLSRQNLPPLEGSSFEGVYRGGYAVVPCANPQLIIIGTGSEVEIAVNAAKKLSDLRVRVVSLPIWSIFDKQPESYKNTVLTEGVPTVSVEVFTPIGWDRYSHFHIGMTEFGLSGSADALYKHFKFTPEHVAKVGKELVKLYKGKAPLKRSADFLAKL